MERQKFTREFKLEAVRLIKRRGFSYVQASEDLGMPPSQLRDRVRSSPTIRSMRFVQRSDEASRSRSARLEREINKLKADRDIPKEAAAYFPKESL